LIEQHSGFLDEGAEGLVRAHGQGSGHRARRISVELARSAEALRARLRPLLAPHEPAVDIVFHCPDYTVRQPGTAGLDPSRIVDAQQREHLVAVVRALTRADDGEPVLDATRRRAGPRFFAALLALVPDVQALAGEANALTTRLSGGLAEWARRITMSPHRLRVTATAGSGKTQLALAAYADALAAGRRPLYVCYNRPLADHFALIVPPGGEVATYHQLCDRRLRAAGRRPAYGAPGAFRRMETEFAELVAGQPEPAWR